jgi:hypothetical protein
MTAGGWGGADETTDCWFDEPTPGDRHSWVIPPGHGTYRSLDLELLHPGDEDELMMLLEAMHGDEDYELDSAADVLSDDAANPRLHVLMHHVVARQLQADEPPETWQAVQRLAGLGYDWHNIMHMIAQLVVHDVYGVLADDRQPDPADYARRLGQLPGDWPPPEARR